MRMTTPNLKWVISSHFKFGVSKKRTINYTLRTNLAFYGWNHQFLYTEEMLEFIFEQLGFLKIEFPKYGESSIPALRNLERHPGFKVEDGYPSQICVEATRSDSPISIPDHLLEVDFKKFFQNMRPPSY